MKRILAIGLLSVLTGCLTAPACAQARIYGLLDQGLVGGFGQSIPASANDLRHNWYAGNGNGMRQNYGSRLGVEAFEDLGGGHKLEVRLEGTVDALHNFYFDRQAILGMSGSFGSLRYGRTRDLINGSASRVDPFTNDGLVQDKILLAQMASIGLFRIPNALTWSSPVVHGLQVSAQFAERQQVADNNALKLLLTWDSAHWGMHAGVDMPGRHRQANGYYQFGPRARNYVAGVYALAGSIRLSSAVLYATRDMGAADTDPSFPRPQASPWGWVGTARMPVNGGEVKLALVRSEQVFSKFGAWQPVEEIGGGYEHFLSPTALLYLQLGHERRSGGGHWHAGLLKRF